MVRRPGRRGGAGRPGQAVRELVRRRLADGADGADDPVVRRLFDAAHYVEQLDRVPSGDPLAHYLRAGWRAGLDPHPLFSTGRYLADEPDVAAADICPLVHYARHGGRELRSPHPLFDPVHYCRSGGQPWDGSTDPLVHYLDTGGAGRQPNPWFDGAFYLAHAPDVAAAGVNPLEHYVRHGWRERRSPHPSFDVAHYLAANPDVAAQGIEPLTHFLRFGRRQGRRPAPDVEPEGHGPCPLDEPPPAAPAARTGTSLSVVVATTDGRPSIEAALAALERQSLDREAYEVVVVVDGSPTGAPTCDGWADGRLRRAVGQPRAGAAAARNLGLFLTRSPIVLFLADDEVADGDLLARHLAAHDRRPALEVAVVGRTTWSPEVAVHPLAAWTAALDPLPFAYPANPCGLPLDETFFRARQLSVKRAFLTRRGVFDPSFERFHDIELGVRLRRFGLTVHHSCAARSTRAVGPDLDDLCEALTAEGPELVRLAAADPRGVVRGLCRVDGASAAWRAAEASYESELAATRSAERAVAAGTGDRAGLAARYHRLLWASRDRGVAAASSAGKGRDGPGSRPTIARDVPAAAPGRRPAVLVVGVVLADRANTAADTAAILAASRRYDVHQRWLTVGRPRGRSSPPLDPSLVAETRRDLAPKYELLGGLLARLPLEAYEHVLLVDDDVVLPAGFLDVFLDVQRDLGFALAQPARALGTPADHPIVLQHPGVLARRTLFVEQGPVLSVHRSVLDAVVPFDLRSPMGWGYECIWSHRLGERAPMGIIDVTPVDHSVRPTAAFYSKADGIAQSAALLAAVPHRPMDDCMRVLELHR